MWTTVWSTTPVTAILGDPEAALRGIERLIGDFDRSNPGGGWAGAAPLDHGLDILSGALEHGLDASIREVPDPADEAARARLLRGRMPEEHALDPPADADARALGLRHGQ